MIKSRFTTNADVSRMVWAGNVSSEQFVGTIKGHLQQASIEVSESLKLSFSKTFSFWIGVDADVVEQDSLDIGGAIYDVRAVQVNDYGANRHKELILEKME